MIQRSIHCRYSFFVQKCKDKSWNARDQYFYFPVTGNDGLGMYRLRWGAVYHTGSVSREGSVKKRLVIKILEQRIARRWFYLKNSFTSADIFVEGAGRNVRKPPVCGHNSSTGFI